MNRSLFRLALGATAVGLIAAPGVFAQHPGPLSPASQPPPVSSAAYSQPAAPPPASTPPAVQLPVTAPPVVDSQATPCPPAPAATPPAPKFDILWNNGLFIQSANKEFSAHVGGTVHYDAAWYHASPLLQNATGGTGRFVDGVNMRRGRMFMEGTLYSAVDYKFEIEFANGFVPAGLTVPAGPTTVSNSPGPTDAWITIKDVPFFGNIRIGNQKEWFSLEHLNNYRALEFMERSYLFDFSQPTAFNNGFSPGVSAFRTWANDRVFSGVGMYKNDSDLIGFGQGNGNYAVTGRLAALPLWMPDDKMFWHVGGAMSHRDPVNGQVQVRIRDEVRNGPFPLLNLIGNTGLVNTDSQTLYNLETAAVFGPLTLQAEYTANVLHGASSTTGTAFGNVFLQGFYTEALVLLTGESRTWNAKNAFFNRVTPKRPIKFKPGEGEEYGWGAWELGVRYTYLDLSNRGLQAGRLDNVTIGLNWYMNTNAKLQFNYDFVRRGDTNNPAQGDVHGFGTRMAVEF